jgi:hypothetical protein
MQLRLQKVLAIYCISNSFFLIQSFFFARTESDIVPSSTVESTLSIFSIDSTAELGAMLLSGPAKNKLDQAKAVQDVNTVLAGLSNWKKR